MLLLPSWWWLSIRGFVIMDAGAAALGGRLSGVSTASIAVVMVPIFDPVDGEDQAVSTASIAVVMVPIFDPVDGEDQAAALVLVVIRQRQLPNRVL
jgi:hypothetical protein